MKSTIFLDPDFNFLLLENEESDTPGETKLFINVHTSAAANQRFDIAVAGASPITIYLPSSASVNFELSRNFWADDAATEITPSNADGTGATLTINFPKSFDTSAALNFVNATEFDISAQSEEFASAGEGAGSSGSGSAFDFVETIRNIGFRLLDEPTNVNLLYDDIAKNVQIKWTDPADINSDEPAPAQWAGTVVVRKEGSAPRHKWDGTVIVDSTTRDEYKTNALVDSTVEYGKRYFYGIFPYDTKGDYRFTKVIQSGETEDPVFEWLFDGSKPSDQQFPSGLDYDLGNISDPGYLSTSVPTISNGYIEITVVNGVAEFIIFNNRLSPCHTLKVSIERLINVSYDGNIHIFGGSNNSGYNDDNPYNNRTIYNIADENGFSEMFHAADLPLGEISTVSIPLNNFAIGMYICIVGNLPVKIHKIWGE